MENAPQKDRLSARIVNIQFTVFDLIDLLMDDYYATPI
mgnify:CR=1 FL=1